MPQSIVALCDQRPRLYHAVGDEQHCFTPAGDPVRKRMGPEGETGSGELLWQLNPAQGAEVTDAPRVLVPAGDEDVLVCLLAPTEPRVWAKTSKGGFEVRMGKTKHAFDLAKSGAAILNNLDG